MLCYDVIIPQDIVQYCNICLFFPGSMIFSMPRRERRKKEQERGRQDAAKGSRTLYDWMKPRVAASTSEQVEEDSEDREETQESEESEAEDMEADDEPNEADNVDDLEQWFSKWG